MVLDEVRARACLCVRVLSASVVHEQSIRSFCQRGYRIRNEYCCCFPNHLIYNINSTSITRILSISVANASAQHDAQYTHVCHYLIIIQNAYKNK